MEAKNGRGRRTGGTGWFATLAGAALLAGSGFAVGLVAGVLFEGPDLVWDELAGRTTPVPLEGDANPLPVGPGVDVATPADVASGTEAAAPLPQVGAAPPAGAAEAVPTEESSEEAVAPAETEEEETVAAVPPPAREASVTKGSASAPAKASLPAVSANPPVRSGFAVQVGAYSDAQGARRLMNQLREAGFTAYVAEGATRGAQFRVRVGPVASRHEADLLAARIERERKLSTWVLAEGPPATQERP